MIAQVVDLFPGYTAWQGAGDFWHFPNIGTVKHHRWSKGRRLVQSKMCQKSGYSRLCLQFTPSHLSMEYSNKLPTLLYHSSGEKFSFSNSGRTATPNLRFCLVLWTLARVKIRHVGFQGEQPYRQNGYTWTNNAGANN